MKHFTPFSDERLLANCVYCGRATESRDHVPSRVLLDERSSDDPPLPVVPACSACNTGFSDHERYLACLIDCVLAGSTNPADLQRPTVRRTLEKRPSLRAEIERMRWTEERGVGFDVDLARLRIVAVKLTQGHAAYELSEPQLGEPGNMGIAPLTSMDPQQRLAFERLGPDARKPETVGWPEIGSRAFQRAVEGWAGNSCDQWLVVQPGRYRYAAYLADGVVVKVVLSEYLAIEARWED